MFGIVQEGMETGVVAGLNYLKRLIEVGNYKK